MNTALLKVIRAPEVGSAHWHVPGFGHSVSYHRLHPYWKVRAVSWPVMVDGYEVLRSARLDWHASVIKTELRRLLKQVAETPRTV